MTDEDLKEMLVGFDEATRVTVLRAASKAVDAHKHLPKYERGFVLYSLGSYAMAYGLVILLVGGVSQKGIKEAFGAAFDIAKDWIAHATIGKVVSLPFKELN